MKKWWLLWILSIPMFLLTYLYSFFLTSKIAYLPQAECKPKFIFTPETVQYCSDIYPIDVFLIGLKNNPISYLCVIFGLYIIGFFIYQIVRLVKFLGK
ncbi:DUF4306 domain-containing protein [Thalassobacillus sp. CUG 92003]|uniref:DUF4306 domain-containing protein n=1 Tax=Thalassobacillus sp. CUG 92003 TaxID=2736641 RepID=UPI0015E65F65|nr:DUF4306 domain-containing protein [Thalassobacillus sp. CUG 92003]